MRKGYGFSETIKLPLIQVVLIQEGMSCDHLLGIGTLGLCALLNIIFPHNHKLQNICSQHKGRFVEEAIHTGWL